MKKEAITIIPDESSDKLYNHISRFEKALELKLEKIKQDLTHNLEIYKSSRHSHTRMLWIQAGGIILKLFTFSTVQDHIWLIGLSNYITERIYNSKARAACNFVSNQIADLIWIKETNIYIKTKTMKENEKDQKMQGNQTAQKSNNNSNMNQSSKKTSVADTDEEEETEGKHGGQGRNEQEGKERNQQKTPVANEGNKQGGQDSQRQGQHQGSSNQGSGSSQGSGSQGNRK